MCWYNVRGGHFRPQRIYWSQWRLWYLQVPQLVLRCLCFLYFQYMSISSLKILQYYLWLYFFSGSINSISFRSIVVSQTYPFYSFFVQLFSFVSKYLIISMKILFFLSLTTIWGAEYSTVNCYRMQFTFKSSCI